MSGWSYRLTLRSRRALPTTDRELKLMAALAPMGLMRMPQNGYSTPAATGTPNGTADLFSQDIMIRGQKARVEGFPEVDNPGVLEVVKDARINAGPVMDGHGRSSRGGRRRRCHSTGAGVGLKKQVLQKGKVSLDELLRSVRDLVARVP
jgi:hypothetical protein